MRAPPSFFLLKPAALLRLAFIVGAERRCRLRRRCPLQMRSLVLTDAASCRRCPSCASREGPDAAVPESGPCALPPTLAEPPPPDCAKAGTAVQG